MRPLKMICNCLALASLASAASAATTDSIDSVFYRADLGYTRPLHEAQKQTRPEAERALIAARLGLARLDISAAANALNRHASLHDTDIARLRLYYGLEQSLAILKAEYSAAADAGVKWVQLPNAQEQPRFASMHQTTVMMDLLRKTSPEQVGKVNFGSVPYTRDKVGLARTEILIEGHKQDVVVDTGASFSVVNASTAKRLNLKMIGAASVGSSTQKDVKTEVAVASHVSVAGTQFDNVVFLVLADDQLSYPSIDYHIDAILGFPELHRLGKLHFTQDTIRIEPAADYTTADANLVFVDTQSFVFAELNKICVPLHLDTGANASSLTRLFANEHPEVLKQLRAEQRQIGGAGGIKEANVLSWKSVPVKIGQRLGPSIDLDIDLAEEVLAPERLGTLGRDALDAGYSIDFNAMRLELDSGKVESTRACLRQ